MTRPARYDSGMINEQLAEELVEADPNDSIQTLSKFYLYNRKMLLFNKIIYIIYI